MCSVGLLLCNLQIIAGNCRNTINQPINTWESLICSVYKFILGPSDTLSIATTDWEILGSAPGVGCKGQKTSGVLQQ